MSSTWVSVSLQLQAVLPTRPTCSFQTWEVFLRSRDSSDNSTGSSFFPLVTLCRQAKLADWLRVGGFCESERLISSAICWAENFFGTRELRKPEPATLLNSWFAGFPLDLLVLPHTNHIQYKIYWEKHKCKENIQSWVIQLAPAFPRPPSSPTRAEHYCQDFDLIASNLHFQESEKLGAIRPIYCWQNLLQQTQILTYKNRKWIQSMFFLD